MIERCGDTYTPICDGCGAELPEEWGLRDALDAIRANDWRLEPPEEGFGYWVHYCRACAGRCDFG